MTIGLSLPDIFNVWDMDDKALDSLGVVELSDQNGGIPTSDGKGNTSRDDAEMAYYGKRQQLKVQPAE